jgi:hypothetical protein
MQFHQLALDLARERQEELIAEAAVRRRIQPRPSSIRRSIGRRLIAAGMRIAAEPSLERARSR